MAIFLENKEERIRGHLTRVLQELQQSQQGTQNRQSLIRKIEKYDGAKPRRLLLYVANVNHPAGGIHYDDIVPLQDALSGFGTAENLDLILHTPGGIGEVAEKIVDLCRRHCKGEFRVIVPNMAKSAGTLIALGADAIIMGYCSELGPIDPQITVVVGGVRQAVSAWTFIQTRDMLEAKVRDAIANKQDPRPYLQELAAIDPVFVTHCEQLMAFAKQLGKKWIADRLTSQGKTEKEATELTNKVIEYLSDVKEHITHGRSLSALELIKHCKPPLDIILLSEEDELWQLIWELYVRCEVFLKSEPQKAKLIETADISISLS